MLSVAGAEVWGRLVGVGPLESGSVWSAGAESARPAGARAAGASGVRTVSTGGRRGVRRGLLRGPGLRGTGAAVEARGPAPGETGHGGVGDAGGGCADPVTAWFDRPLSAPRGRSVPAHLVDGLRVRPFLCWPVSRAWGAATGDGSRLRGVRGLGGRTGGGKQVPEQVRWCTVYPSAVGPRGRPRSRDGGVGGARR